MDDILRYCPTLRESYTKLEAAKYSAYNCHKCKKEV